MVNLAANMSARHMVALVAPSEMHYTIDFYVSNCLKLFLPCGEVYSILIQSGGNGRTWWAQLLDSFLHLFVFLLSQRSSWSRQLATGQHASYSCQSSPQLILILNICTDLLSFPVQNPPSRHHKTDRNPRDRYFTILRQIKPSAWLDTTGENVWFLIYLTNKSVWFFQQMRPSPCSFVEEQAE